APPSFFKCGAFHMVLQIASGLLRRLPDSIYASAQPEAQETQVATQGSISDSTSMADLTPDSTSYDPSLVIADNATQETLVSDDYSPPPTSPLENFATRSVHETSARRRQSLTAVAVTPDVNAQTALRKRILDIQTLDIPEPEKARRIQV